ncbi:MAG TPA: FxLYD domain-containing protein [Thermoanaerobaculaceae bacterium]|nr:FxLYD domain-containing protein [Thermoanaerobaculaceae bacterium]HRS15729.1 FxLYD domain-containing protein [Thermoanaerobaculaceae bacterium]
MKKVVIASVLLLVAGSVMAATLVLKGGKRLEVKSFVQQGNVMVVTLPDGRMQSYPMAAVDTAATSEANPAPSAQPAARPSGPRSPFAAAKAEPGEATLVVTDADVAHAAGRDDEEEAAGGEKEKAPAGAGAAKVEVVQFGKRDVSEGQWEVDVVVANVGDADAGGVSVTAHATDVSGNTLGSGSGSVQGKLEPGKQASLSIRMAALDGVASFRFDVSYQSIKPVPPPPTPGAEGGAAPAGAASSPAASATPRVTRVQAPPNMIPSVNQAGGNPNAQLPLTAPPTAPPASR